MTGIIRSKTEEAKQDKELVKKIKPKLRDYVIKEQQMAAIEAVKEQDDYKKKVNEFQALARIVVKRAEVLSIMCFVEKKLWLQIPPTVEMKWLNKTVSSPQLEAEQKQDMWAFARYLFNEFFRNYMEHKDDKAGYPNPMEDKNLQFFWAKFNADLSLVIKADQMRINKGNKGVILDTKIN